MADTTTQNNNCITFTDNSKKVKCKVESYLANSFLKNVYDGTDQLLELVDDNMDKLGEYEYLKILNILRDMRRHVQVKNTNTYTLYPKSVNRAELYRRCFFNVNYIDNILNDMKHFKNLSITNCILTRIKIKFIVQFQLKINNELDSDTSITIHFDRKTTRTVFGNWNELIYNLYLGFIQSMNQKYSDNNLSWKQQIVRSMSVLSEVSDTINSWNNKHNGLWKTLKKKIVDTQYSEDNLLYLHNYVRLYHYDMFKLVKDKLDFNLYKVFDFHKKNENYRYISLYKDNATKKEVFMNVKIHILKV